MNNKQIAQRVRELREQRKLTQEEVADVLGMGQPAYSDLEKGSTTFKAVQLDKLATFYGLSLDELLRGGQPVLTMNEHASHGYLQSTVQNGVSDDLIKRICDLLESNVAMNRELGGLLQRMSRHLDQREK
ncbi:MAG TPA: helix-turn-helix transcriptional regulator [Flavobacteriales bacterium]|nr:helix-turn-helix transcriptional regulator [Flavobacteriales bacterium]HMR25960.1 helix-turn-helix transcriptional regulator [Flavobacteriales bacterium]